MSGHSKWAQIKHKKGITDKKKGRLFSKLAREIMVASREGDNPETNFKLRLAIEKAKAANMPSENIQRAIDKGSGKIKGEELEQFVLEAYGPGGVALLIEVLTDNRNRAVAEIRGFLSKNNGRLAEAGAVSWLFEKKGFLVIENCGVSKEAKEEVEMMAIDAGASDIQEEGNDLYIYTEVTSLEKVKKFLEEANVYIASSGIMMSPKQTIPINDEKTAQLILKLMDSLEDLDDVVAVYANFDIPNKIMEKLAAS